MSNFWIAWDIQDSLDNFGMIAFSVLQCRGLLVYVYCLFVLTELFATMSPSGRRLSFGSQLNSSLSGLSQHSCSLKKGLSEEFQSDNSQVRPFLISFLRWSETKNCHGRKSYQF